MLFAKLVLGLPIEGPFDYLVPDELEPRIKVGVRCEVPLRNKKMVGYVVGISKKTFIKKIKPIYSIIDEMPILSKDMLILTRQVSKYYFCSWGEVIETALPRSLRAPRGVKLEPISLPNRPNQITKTKHRATLIHDFTGEARWQIYLNKIRERINASQGVIFLTPEIESAIEIQKILKDNFHQDVALQHSQQDTSDSLSQWQGVKNNQTRIVVGTRQAVFSPVHNLGLIIVDNESDESFKQDQTPHYNARDVAFMRARLKQAELLLGSHSPSLEMYHLAKMKKIEYVSIEKKELPELKVIDRRNDIFYKRKGGIFSLPFQNALTESLQRKEKVIIFLNRKGFATYAACPSCKTTIRCPRCNVNLVYHFKENRLICHYCNYKIEVPKICPNCNACYIRYSGIGTEKIESELCRLYPAAKILILDNKTSDIPEDNDILIATSLIFRHRSVNFGLIGIASIDNYLNRNDFRAAEKTFSMLMQLANLGAKRLVIQTSLPKHYCFNALINSDVHLFYKEELTFRRQLDFPPFTHMALIKLRGRVQEKVEEQAQALFYRLNKNKGINIVSCFSGQPPKLRGNFYWQILIKSKSVEKINEYLKKRLKDYSHSGIIVTVDVDPI